MRPAKYFNLVKWKDEKAYRRLPTASKEPAFTRECEWKTRSATNRVFSRGFRWCHHGVYCWEWSSMFQLRLECCFAYGFFQSLNVIESPELRRIFLMLREELRDSDIPHRSKMRDCIMEVFMEHIETLKSDMEVRSHHSWAHNAYIIVYLESTWEDFIHDGYVVWPKSLPFHGGNSALDRNNTCRDTPGPPTHFKAPCWLDWISVRSRSSYRRAPRFCIHARSWVPWNFAEGMYISYHDNSILMWILLLDWVGNIRQCFEQRYIYGQACIWAPQASYPFWFRKPENKVTFYFITKHLYWHHNRCFPHVVNLACKAVLSLVSTTFMINYRHLPAHQHPHCLMNLWNEKARQPYETHFISLVLHLITIS